MMTVQNTFIALNYLVYGAFKPLRLYDTQSFAINHAVWNPNQSHVWKLSVILVMSWFFYYVTVRSCWLSYCHTGLCWETEMQYFNFIFWHAILFLFYSSQFNNAILPHQYKLKISILIVCSFVIAVRHYAWLTITAYIFPWDAPQLAEYGLLAAAPALCP